MDEQQQTKTLFGPRVKAALPKFGKFMAEATPIIGDAIAAEEVYKELQKDEPNYFLAGALGGAAIVGLVPGLGDAAASAIRAGARKALDTAKRVQVDPTALGSMGGNIRLKPKENIWSYPEQLYDSAETSINVSKKPAGYNELKKRGEIKDNELIVDIGGGKFDNLVEDAAKEGATVKVYDPFNRTPEHNAAVVNEIKDGQADMAMSHNVLNVIQEDKNIINIARQAENAIKPNGKAHFSVYEGTGTGVGKVTTKGYQRNEKTKNYVPLIENVFGKGNVIRKGKIITATKSINNFNKGGTVMNRQMEMAFMQQGGLKDDGMKVDPVSGNEIPPGSLAKEVRDDIPAQLSEGEYVVPADVVQYYGVKHFEDLRDKAKGGLQQMERDGRIGGEPVPAGGPKAGPAGQMMKQQPPPMPPKPPVTSGMTQAPIPPAPKQMAMGGPLTAEEMQEIRKMANGGMVQMADPYQQQKAMYQQPQGMSLGGSPFIPNIGTGFSWEATGPGSITPQPPKQVTLYGPNGEVENLILPADQTKYDTLIAQGYTETAPVTPMFTSSRSKDDSPEPPKPKPWYETTDFTAGSAGGKASAAKYFGTEGKIGSVVGGIAGSIFGGPVGGAIGSYGIKVSNLASARAEVTLRKAMGDTNGANALQKAIDNQLKTSKALGYADDAIDAVFGSDGDMKVISALQAAGIKVDRSLRDDDLDDFMDNLSSNDKDKLIDRYGDKKTTPIVSTPKSKEPTTTVDTSGDPRGEPDRDRPRPPSTGFGDEPPGAPGFPSQSIGGGGGGSTSGGGVSYGGREDTSGFGGSTGVPGGRNKGGLMQRKKVKKK